MGEGTNLPDLLEEPGERDGNMVGSYEEIIKSQLDSITNSPFTFSLIPFYLPRIS